MVITVVPGLEGRQLFKGTRDPRIHLAASADHAVDPDLVVFPCGQDRRFEQVAAATLPDHLAQRIADGRTGIVFDASTEGVPQKPDVTQALHAVIAQLKASRAQCAYVTQERNYEADYRAYCAASGEEAGVTIVVHDYWIWDALTHFETSGTDVYERRLDAFRERPRRRPRRFVSLNRTPRPAKIVFLRRLLHDRLWDHGFVSFGGFRARGGGPGKARPSEADLLRALPGFEDMIADTTAEMEALDRYGRVLLGPAHPDSAPLEHWGADTELPEYAQSWFSVATDTEMRDRPSRITEKLLKPLLNFHPMIVLGNPGALSMVREYGFRTFPEIIDESYDEARDPRRRFELAYAEVARLCGLDDDAWSRLEGAIEETLLFNARWGLTEMPTVRRQANDVALVDQILRAVKQPR